MQSSSCQSWYFVWVFGYEDAEFILPKLEVCLGILTRACSAHPAKNGTLSGLLDMRMQSSSCQICNLSGFLSMRMQSSFCQSWYFVWVFGYEDAELILPKLVLCLGFWI